MRLWLCAVVLCAVAGCLVDIDYGGTEFTCSESETCPDGRECVNQRCVEPGFTPDGPLPALRHPIEVVTSLPGPVTDAPVLVALTAERIDYSRAAADGSDLRFTASDGSVLAHEIETWDPAGTSIVWVKMPTLDTGVTFAMAYGDGLADSQQPAEVWSAYDLVYHLNGSGADSRLGFDGTAQGGVLHEPGLLGGAARFDGVDDYFDLGRDVPLMRNASGATISGWIRATAYGGAIMEISQTGGTASRVFATTLTTGAPRLGIRTTDDPGPAETVSGLRLVPLDEWTWFVGVADFAAQTIAVYLDGVESGRGEMLLLDPTTPDTNAGNGTLGADDTFGVNGFIAGMLDEVRCIPRAVDTNWIVAQYVSMTDNLLSFGPGEPL